MITYPQPARHDRCVIPPVMTNNENKFRLPVSSLGFLTCCATAACDDSDATASRNARAQLTAQMKRNVATGSRTLATVSQQSKYLDEDAGTGFETVVNRVRSAEQRLHSALNGIQSASEDEWPRARAALTASYQIFSHGIAQVEVAVRVEPSSPRRDPQRR